MFSQKKFWLGLFFLNLALRAASFYTPILDIDEAQFAGFARVLLDGGVPYRDSLDTKPLGIYYFYAAIFKIFGAHNMIAVHWVTALLIFFTAYFLFRIFKNFSLEKEGQWAALFFIVFSTTYFPKYIATSINSVMMFFGVASVMVLVRTIRRGGVSPPVVSLPEFAGGVANNVVDLDTGGETPPLRILFSGLLLGIAFLFKYQAGIQWPMVFSFLFYLCWQRQISRRDFLILNLAFALGFFVPFGLHSLWLVKLGVWSDFLQWSVLGSGSYIAAGGEMILFWKSFVIRFGSYVLATLLLWVLAGRVIWQFVCGQNQDRAWQENRARHAVPLRMLMLLWFAFSLIPVCIAGRFYGHYFLQVLPSLCGLAALGVVPLITAAGGRTGGETPPLRIIAAMVVPALFFWALRVDHRTFLKHFPDDEIYEQETIGLVLKKMAGPGDKLFVWGFATGIYFHAELKPASRFLWTDLQTGRTPGPDYAKRGDGSVPTEDGPAPIKDGPTPTKDGPTHGSAPTQNIAWSTLMQDLITNRPRFFVDTAPANIHGYKEFPIMLYPPLSEFLATHYNKVASIQGADIYELSK